MTRHGLHAVIAGVYLSALPAWGAPTLKGWVDNFSQPVVQQEILSKIFPGQMGSISEAKRNKNGTFYFLKNNSWVRLGASVVYDVPSPGRDYFVVSAMLYRDPSRPPVTATSYLFRSPTERPSTISAGYAAHEEVDGVILPKLKKHFVFILDSSNYEPGATGQWSAFLLDIEPGEQRDQPRTVWNSPQSTRSFRVGFDTLGGTAEELILRVNKNGDLQYSAYRWNGSRFEVDSFAFESRIKALPEDVWQYGVR